MNRRFAKRSVFLFFVFTLVSCTNSIDETSTYYSVFTDDVLSGIKQVTTNTVRTEGGTRLIIEVESLNKQIVDSKQIIKMNFRYELDSTGSALLSLKNKINFGNQIIEAIFSVENDTVFVVSNSRPIAAIEIPENGLFDNTIYYPFLLSEFENQKSQIITRDVFIPQSMAFDPIQYELLDLSTLITFLGSIPVHHIREINLKTGAQKTKWIDSNTAMVIRTDWNYRREILSTNVNEDDLKYADLTKIYFYPLELSSPENQAYQSLLADIKAKTYGGFARVALLNTTNQVFRGKVNQQDIAGAFETSSIQYRKLPPVQFPLSLDSLSEDVADFLKPEQFINSEYPEFKILAKQLTSGTPSLQESVNSIARFVDGHIQNEDRTVLGAQTVYKTRTGDCVGQSQLMTALLRSAHIPARLASGVAISSNKGGSLGQHIWLEYFDPVSGWIPYDVTLNQFEVFSAAHIKLTDIGNCTIKDAKILNFSLL